MPTRADAIKHANVGDRRLVPRALQLEFRGVDAERHVGGENKKQVDRLGRMRSMRKTNSECCHQSQQMARVAHVASLETCLIGVMSSRRADVRLLSPDT